MWTSVVVEYLQVWMVRIPDHLDADPQDIDTPRTVVVHPGFGTLRGSNDWMNLRGSRLTPRDAAARMQEPLLPDDRPFSPESPLQSSSRWGGGEGGLEQRLSHAGQLGGQPSHVGGTNVPNQALRSSSSSLQINSQRGANDRMPPLHSVNSSAWQQQPAGRSAHSLQGGGSGQKAADQGQLLRQSSMGQYGGHVERYMPFTSHLQRSQGAKNVQHQQRADLAGSPLQMGQSMAADR